MRKATFISLLLLFVFNSAFTQYIKEGEKTFAYIHIYKLNIPEVEKWNKTENFTPDSTYFHTLYDSFPARKVYNKRPSPGYYLFVKVTRGTINYKMVIVSDLITKMLNNGKDLSIRIIEKEKNKDVSGAKIIFRDKIILYDTLLHAYLLPGKQKRGTMRIEANGETLFLDIDKEYNSKRKKFSENEYTGYIAFSQPRYRIGDTVKLKAFICRNGKPLIRTLELRVPREYGYSGYYEKNDTNQYLFKARLKPISPGSYVYSFVAGDSMKVDQAHFVYFYENSKPETEWKNHPLISSDFYIEDYQLDQTSYSVRTAKEDYSFKDTVSLYLSGKDFNGLPLFDASAEVIIEATNLLEPAANKEDIAFETYRTTVPLEPEGETRVIIPSNVFSRSGISYTAAVNFKNSNNELQSSYAYFSLKQLESSIDVTDEDSSITARYFENEKDIPAKGIMWYEDEDDSVLTKKINFPFSFIPSPFYSTAYFECNGIKTKFTLPFSSKIEFAGHRTKDSLVINVTNPRKIWFNWELKKDGAIFKKGRSQKFIYSEKDLSTAVYSFKILYNWMDENKTEEKNILAPEKTLKVKIEEPLTVYPGQKTDVSVKVLDFNDHPVKDANLTVDCINSQFGDEKIPEPPSFNPNKGIAKKEYQWYSSDERGRSTYEDVNSYWYKRMRLDTIHTFHLWDPGKEFYSKYIPTKTDNAQFAPFIISHGRTLHLFFIYVDDKPIYERNDYYDHFGWSFIVPAGKHSIRIRTEDQEYTLNDIEFKTGSKLEFSFDGDHPPASVKTVKRKRKLNDEEKKIIAGLFYLGDVGGYMVNQHYFSQGNTIKELDEYSSTYFIPGDSIHYKIYLEKTVATGAFLFVPGKRYNFNSSGIKPEDHIVKMKRLPKYKFSSYYPGETAVTADQTYRSNLSYGYTSWGNPAAAYNTQKENGALIIDQTENPDISRFELINEDSKRAYFSVENNYINNEKPFVTENIPPGKYKAVLYNEAGDLFTVDSILIKAGALHFEKIGKRKFTSLEKIIPQNVKCDNYELTYFKNPFSIVGKLHGKLLPAQMEGERVNVSFNGEGKGQIETDVNGVFHIEAGTQGIYGLSFKNDTAFAEINIDGIKVSENYSAKIDIYLKDTVADSINFSRYNLIHDNENIILRDNITSEKTYSIGYSKEKIKYEFYNKFAGSEIKDYSPQYFHDKTEFTVDGSTIEEYYHRSRSLYHSRSLFYKERRVQRGGRVSFGDKGLATNFGWNFGDASEGGFELNKRRNYKYADYVNYVPPLADPDSKEGYQKYYYENGYLRSRGDNMGIAGRYNDQDTYDADGNMVYNIMPGILNLNVDKSFGSTYMIQLAILGGNKLRTSFSDCAYWKPNLLTNDSGIVKFNVIFPDNITRWDTWALASTANKQNGKGNVETRSYKPLLATLSLPRFFMPGDSAFAVGKVMNYTKDAIDLKTNFKLENTVLKTSDQKVSNGFNEKQLIIADKEDSLHIEYSLETKEGYLDGERQIIPVYPVGCEEAKGFYYFLNKDSSFTVTFADTSGKTEMAVLDNDLDVLLSRLKYIKDYIYFCNEQIASKLSALLMEKTIYEKLGKNFKSESEIHRMIKKLERSQKQNGSWSWWDDPLEQSNLFMTAYITHTLARASAQGFNSDALKKGLDQLQFQLPELTGNDLVYVMSILSENKMLNDPKKYISLAERNSSLTTWSRYKLIQLKQRSGIAVDDDVKKLLKDKKETVLGGYYWGDHTTEWYDNSSSLSIIAYQILENVPGQEKIVDGIRNYFFEPSNTNIYRNTYESACILETVLPDALAKYKDKLAEAKLELKGGVTGTISKFPYIAGTRLKNTSVTVSKTGSSPLYFSLYQKKWNTSPTKNEELFAIQTHFEQENIKVEKVNAGKVAELVVDVNVKKKGDYIMINVPIPAGCSYDDKKQPYSNNEVHREYFKDKVSIFCESLPIGNYKFTIELQPRFTGSYHLNPCTAELMYFPIFSGRNEMKKINIIEK